MPVLSPAERPLCPDCLPNGDLHSLRVGSGRVSFPMELEGLSRADVVAYGEALKANLATEQAVNPRPCERAAWVPGANERVLMDALADLEEWCS